MKIVITGPKGAGKSTAARLLGERTGLRVVETDEIIVRLWREQSGQELSVPQIYRANGEGKFRALERAAAEEAAEMEWVIISVGGSTLLDPRSRRLLRRRAIWVYFDTRTEVLWERIMAKGVPAYLEGEADPAAAYAARVERIREVITSVCDCVIDTADMGAEEAAEAALEDVKQELAVRSGEPNTFGQVIRLTTFGESHGPMIGAVLDGVRPGIELSEADVQEQLDRRRPGQGAVTTARSEADRVRIVSGVFEGKTTGASIGMLIENADSKSGHYDEIRELFRPGHADFTFWKKYGIRDHRGGGRSSGRETACRVAGGAVARKILAERGVAICAYTTRVGKVAAERVEYGEIERNSVRCPDTEAAERMEKEILDARAAGNSVGGIIQLEVRGLPAGLGDPVFGKLDARLAGAIMSIGSVKGVEFGAGFAAAKMCGSEDNDQMEGGRFVTNNAGGVLGGISTGETLVVRAAIKPTPSISTVQKTCDTSGGDREISTKGRHDPCIAPRAVPVVEAMAALVLLDMWEMQEQLNPGWREGK